MRAGRRLVGGRRLLHPLAVSERQDLHHLDGRRDGDDDVDNDGNDDGDDDGDDSHTELRSTHCDPAWPFSVHKPPITGHLYNSRPAIGLASDTAAPDAKR